MRRLKTRVVFVLLLCSLLLASLLFYLMLTFDDEKRIVPLHIDNSKPLIVRGFDELRNNNETLHEIFRRKLELRVRRLTIARLSQPDFESDAFVRALKDDLRVDENLSRNFTQTWLIAKRWVRARQTFPLKAPQLGSILRALQVAKIVKSDVSRKGTQLKLLLTLEGGQYVLFKPMRVERDYIANGIYAGTDRHNGEIFGFHISRILNLRYSPIVASRRVDVVREIKQVASESLINTFVNQTEANDKKTQSSQNCFYGECYYCNEFDLTCPDQRGELEGAMILMLPLHYKLTRLRNPWQRTYKQSVKPAWEDDSHYCLAVQKNTANRERILDMVHTSIFDFILQNADRHHYEAFKDVSNSALLFIDNGKSFGNPSHDEITILYPLLQCCIVRNATYQHLKRLAKLKLSRIAEYLISDDILWPLLTNAHMEALDRRLVMVIAAIELCFETFNESYVLQR